MIQLKEILAIEISSYIELYKQLQPLEVEEFIGIDVNHPFGGLVRNNLCKRWALRNNTTVPLFDDFTVQPPFYPKIDWVQLYDKALTMLDSYKKEISYKLIYKNTTQLENFIDIEFQGQINFYEFILDGSLIPIFAIEQLFYNEIGYCENTIKQFPNTKDYIYEQMSNAMKMFLENDFYIILKIQYLKKLIEQSNLPNKNDSKPLSFKTKLSGSRELEIFEKSKHLFENATIEKYKNLFSENITPFVEAESIVLKNTTTILKLAFMFDELLNKGVIRSKQWKAVIEKSKAFIYSGNAIIAKQLSDAINDYQKANASKPANLFN